MPLIKSWPELGPSGRTDCGRDGVAAKRLEAGYSSDSGEIDCRYGTKGMPLPSQQQTYRESVEI